MFADYFGPHWPFDQDPFEKIKKWCCEKKQKIVKLLQRYGIDTNHPQ